MYYVVDAFYFFERLNMLPEIPNGLKMEGCWWSYSLICIHIMDKIIRAERERETRQICCQNDKVVSCSFP